MCLLHCIKVLNVLVRQFSVFLHKFGSANMTSVFCLVVCSVNGLIWTGESPWIDGK